MFFKRCKIRITSTVGPRLSLKEKLHQDLWIFMGSTQLLIKRLRENSLIVQWLELSASTAGGPRFDP